jgi:hypothetical protein
MSRPSEYDQRGADGVPETLELPIFQVQKKKW